MNLSGNKVILALTFFISLWVFIPDGVCQVSISEPDYTLVQAVGANNAGRLSKMLKEGKDPDFQEPIAQGAYTALLLAAQAGHNHCVKLLLKHKANPWIKCRDGEMAITKAKRFKHAVIVRLLKSYMAKYPINHKIWREGKSIDQHGGK